MHNTINASASVVRPGRVIWIDLLRALAMIFVVFGHTIQTLEGNWIFHVFFSPIKIPLFFAISGYLFNDRKGNIKDFFVNLLMKLVIPWLFLSLIWMKAFLIPFKGPAYWLGEAYDVVSGDAFWYMPACIIAEVILFFILKFAKFISGKNRMPAESCLVVSMMIVCTIAGFVCVYFNIGNFAMLNRALIAQSFLLIGYACKKFEQKLAKHRKTIVIAGLLAYLAMGVLSILVFPGRCMDVHLNVYPSLSLCYLMIYIGCATLFFAGPLISKVPKVLTMIGQNTLVCYILHSYILVFFRKGPSVLGFNMPMSWPVAILQTVLAFAMCIIAALVLNRTVPVLVGRKKAKKASVSTQQ